MALHAGFDKTSPSHPHDGYPTLSGHGVTVRGMAVLRQGSFPYPDGRGGGALTDLLWQVAEAPGVREAAPLPREDAQPAGAALCAALAVR